MWEEIIAELMLDNITPIKSDREALKEIQTIIAAKSEAVRRHQVGTAENKNLRCRVNYVGKIGTLFKNVNQVSIRNLRTSGNELHYRLNEIGCLFAGNVRIEILVAILLVY